MPRYLDMGRSKPRRADSSSQQVIRFPAGRMTPEQLARINVSKLPSPPGKPELAQVSVRLALRRDVLERLTARAIEEGRKVEAVIEELLEDASRRVSG